MSYRILLSLVLLCCFASGMQCFADEEATRLQIKQWIQQLGDDSFLVRQRAESLLIRSGMLACSELQRAKQSHDVEIVRRAEFILSQIEQAFLDTEDQETAFWLQHYMNAPDLTTKGVVIWFLADPMSDMKKGEGLQTLCRLVRHEESTALRLEAAKTLIASPPFLPLLRQKWYQHIRDYSRDTGDDELLACLSHYAKLWCDMNDADEKTTDTFQEQVRQVGTETLRLLERPENIIQKGSSIDILLHYAVAELQDAAGLTEDRDKTIAAALAVQPGKIQSAEIIQILNLRYGHTMSEHYHVGKYLRWRFRLHWAMAHFQKVIESGHPLLQVEASMEAAEAALFFADYSSAAAFFDKQIEILNSPEYVKSGHNPPPQDIASAQRHKAYCLAEQAAAEENWEGVQEAITRAWSIPNASVDIDDTDLVILAYRLGKQQPDLAREFKDKTESVLKLLVQDIVQKYNSAQAERRIEAMPGVCNSVAWLLANTDGDYSSALMFIETALQIYPDDANFLDTLAHVYFLGGKVDEAIRTQEKIVRLAPEVVIFRQGLERFQRAKKAE